MVQNDASSHKTNYIVILSDILNLEGHQNRFIGSQVTAILLSGWILRNGGASSGRVCGCSLRSRLFYYKIISIFSLRIPHKRLTEFSVTIKTSSVSKILAHLELRVPLLKWYLQNHKSNNYLAPCRSMIDSSQTLSTPYRQSGFNTVRPYFQNSFP